MVAYHESVQPRSRRRQGAGGIRTGSRDLVRTVAIASGLVTVFAIAFAVSNSWQVRTPQHRTVIRSAQSDNNLTTGSIVFVPQIGDICRENVIENATWIVREVGKVPCQEVLPGGLAGIGLGPLTRVDIIRESFRRAPPPGP